MSTRRARIKAVTALPPRRKNVQNAAGKKKQEETKEGFESGINKPGSARRPSLDKTIKDQQITINSNIEQKEGFEEGVSVSKRRLSVDKNQGRRRLSVDKTVTENACENVTKTPKSRRLSIDKTPKRRLSIEITLNKHSSADKSSTEECENDAKTPRVRRLSIDKTPKRRFSIEISSKKHSPVDKTTTETCENVTKTPRERQSSTEKTPKRRLSIEITPKKRLSVEIISSDVIPIEKSAVSAGNDSNPIKTGEQTSVKPFVESWFPKILKNLLNSNDKPSKKLREDKVPSEYNPSTSKEKESNPSDRRKEILKHVPNEFFASPIISMRPSPIVRTPIIEVDLTAENFIAPHKGPNSVSSERNYIEMDTDVNQKSTDPKAQVIVNNLNESSESEDTGAPTKKSKYPVKIIEEYIIKPTSEVSAVVMDGIVPLQPVSKAPKPLDLLKNEIISENAEVLFDPIVPLPSPSKVRPKLRPVPRFGPRRNSFQQGSASESEDENRRLHGRPATPATPGPSRKRNDSHTSHATTIIQRDVARVRNDSVCSSISQAPSHIAAMSSPLREREKSLKSRREEMTARRNAAMRRRQMEVERDKLTMYDLIFYNPKGNPIIPDQDEIKAKEANKKEEEDRKADTTKQSKVEPESAPTAVPQIKLGPDGEIILDEQSLVVNQSDQRKLASAVIREGAWGGSGSRAYRRTPRTADWSDDETVRFYRALAAMGTDFTLMQPLFPTRTRRDLKLKFKKEERLNLAQVDMALRSGALWDPTRLETEFKEERKAAEEAADKAKERLKREKEEEKERERDMKNLRKRRSKCSKTLGDSGMPKTFGQSKTAPSTLDEYVQFQEERAKMKKQPKKRKVIEIVPANVKSLNGVIVSPPARTPSPSLATLTLVDRRPKIKQNTLQNATKEDMATITKEAALPAMPGNIEAGSLVVLTVNDPKSPSRKMLQTYIAQGPGNLAPVSLPANFLNSVVGFMNSPVSASSSGTPKSKNNISPRKRTSSYTLPAGVSVSAAKSNTPNILSNRKRTNSYTITQL